MVEWWSGGVVEWWSGGVVEWWSGGVVEWWSGGVVESWSREVESWSGGVVEWWSGGVSASIDDFKFFRRPSIRALDLNFETSSLPPLTPSLIAPCEQ